MSRRLTLSALSAAIISLGCQSQEPAAPGWREATEAPAEAHEVGPTTVVRGRVDPEARAAAERSRARRETLEAQRQRDFLAAVERARDYEELNDRVGAVRAWSQAADLAPDAEAQRGCDERARTLMSEQLALAEPAAAPSRGDAAAAEVESAGLELDDEPAPTARPLPPIPDYSSLSEAETEALLAATTPAGRRRAFLAPHSSFLSQARAALGSGLESKRAAADRQDSWQRGEAQLLAFQRILSAYRSELQEPHHAALDAAFDGSPELTREARLSVFALQDRLREELRDIARVVTQVRLITRDSEGVAYAGVGVRERELTQDEAQLLWRSQTAAFVAALRDCEIISAETAPLALRSAHLRIERILTGEVREALQRRRTLRAIDLARAIEAP